MARDLSAQSGFVTRVLDAPFALEITRCAHARSRNRLPAVAVRFFHFDPTFAPAGETAVTCFLPTHNFAFWVELQRHDPPHYQAEKRRIAEAMIAIMKKMAPDFRNGIETTVIRYTRNWRGSMEGWPLTPGMGYKPLRDTLPGLRRFAGNERGDLLPQAIRNVPEFGVHANAR